MGGGDRLDRSQNTPICRIVKENPRRIRAGRGVRGALGGLCVLAHNVGVSSNREIPTSSLDLLHWGARGAIKGTILDPQEGFPFDVVQFLTLTGLRPD